MTLEKQTKIARERYPKKMPTLGRIKAGKIMMGIVALPLGTSILAPFAAVMMIPITPSLWAKDKIRYFKEYRSLR